MFKFEGSNQSFIPFSGCHLQRIKSYPEHFQSFLNWQTQKCHFLVNRIVDISMHEFIKTLFFANNSPVLANFGIVWNLFWMWANANTARLFPAHSLFAAIDIDTATAARFQIRSIFPVWLLCTVCAIYAHTTSESLSLSVSHRRSFISITHIG